MTEQKLVEVMGAVPGKWMTKKNEREEQFRLKSDWNSWNRGRGKRRTERGGRDILRRLPGAEVQDGKNLSVACHQPWCAIRNMLNANGLLVVLGIDVKSTCFFFIIQATSLVRPIEGLLELSCSG